MDLTDDSVREFVTVLVQAAATGVVGLVRKVPALFKRQGAGRVEFVAAELERAEASLRAAGGDGGREFVRQEATWEVLVRGLLAEHPEAAVELAALAVELRDALAEAPRTVYHQQVSGGSAGAQGPGASATVYQLPQP